MKFGEKRTKFTKMSVILVLYAELLGFECRWDKEHCHHHPNSLHYEGLAKDLLLFRDGVYLTDTTDYAELGKFWQCMGGAWGGEWNDGNHFSLKHEGMR